MPEVTFAKIYADQPVLKASSDNEGLTGTKTMKWALVPEEAGRIEIPSLSMSFFDTENHRYRQIETAPFFLSVLPGEDEAVETSLQNREKGATENPIKKEITTLGQDILPVHTSMSDLTSAHHNPPTGIILWLLLISPCLVYTIAFLGTRLKKRSASTMAATKARKAAKVLVKKCHQEKPEANDFFLAIRDYFNDRFDLSLGVLTADEAADLLIKKGVSRKTASTLNKALQELENAVYMGKGKDYCHLGEDMSALIKKIEKELP